MRRKTEFRSRVPHCVARFQQSVVQESMITMRESNHILKRANSSRQLLTTRPCWQMKPEITRCILERLDKVIIALDTVVKVTSLKWHLAIGHDVNF